MREKPRLIAVSVSLAMLAACQAGQIEQARISTQSVAEIEQDGLVFRDLNRNSSLDPYEDWRLPAEERADDLLARMTLEEKVGQIAHGNIFPASGGEGEDEPIYDMDYLGFTMQAQKITAFLPYVSAKPAQFAAANNAVQAMAENGRLAIPATISTDPRHHFFGLVGASSAGEGYSLWPEPIGLAALDDPELTQRFGQIAAQEYRATGFNQALSPQADLATEPRWARIYHSFGEDPEIAARMVGAYIRGFQGGDDGVQPGHVSAVVKHWVGYGAAKDGWDSHNYYGRFADLSEEDLQQHLRPFESAFDVSVSSVMPAYSVFDGLTVNGDPVEPVGAGYSSVLVRGLLRGTYGFDGVVLSDWAITNDCVSTCRNGAPAGEVPRVDRDIATSWGVEDLSIPERFALAMNAGVDQFGGVNDVSPILEAVEQGLIAQDRIDRSVKRILIKTFSAGLFENPFVEVDAVSSMVNTEESRSLGLAAQSRAMVVLKRDVDSTPLLQEAEGRLYLHNFSSELMSQSGFVLSDNPSQSDVAIVRLSAPFELLHPQFFFGSKQHEGSLAFDPDGEEMALLRQLDAAGTRIILSVALDRPAILTDVAPFADVLLVEFGASDAALLNVLDGTIEAEGKLPFELPSSMQAVETQISGKPADSADPLYQIGTPSLSSDASK